MKNIKLKLIREKIDKLDDKLLNLMKIRTNLVTSVLKQKRYKNQIVDKVRIKEILTSIKKKSISKKIDPKLTKRIWKNIIRAYIDFEKKNFKKNNYLLCGGNFFSIKISCLRVAGLYFLTFSLIFAFSPVDGFLT